MEQNLGPVAKNNDPPARPPAIQAKMICEPQITRSLGS